MTFSLISKNKDGVVFGTQHPQMAVYILLEEPTTNSTRCIKLTLLLIDSTRWL